MNIKKVSRQGWVVVYAFNLRRQRQVELGSETCLVCRASSRRGKAKKRHSVSKNKQKATIVHLLMALHYFVTYWV